MARELAKRAKKHPKSIIWGREETVAKSIGKPTKSLWKNGRLQVISPTLIAGRMTCVLGIYFGLSLSPSFPS